MSDETSDDRPTARSAVTDDTIVAIATPPGRGGIGIVRLSGPAAGDLISKQLQMRSALEPGRARFCVIVDQGVRLDEAVVTFFAAPHSYTGEDVLEIAAHGSPVILDLLVRRALEAGARLARPGEFTQRAFLNGRLDLTQAEAVRDLIAAETLYQVRVAAAQLEGSLSRSVAPAKEALLELIALLEAGIDFAEDDIDITPDAELLQRLDNVEALLRPLAASYREGRLVHNGLTMAIVGQPNAGKSSLFNRLVERDRAIVTATPGTTRDLVTERIALEGIPVELVDTAGLRETTDEAEQHGVARTRGAMAEADVVLLVIDAARVNDDSHALVLDAQDRVLLDSLTDRQPVVVLNKIDLRPELATHRGEAEMIAVSARTGEGVSALRARLLARAGSGAAAGSGAILTSLRHFEALTGALDATARAHVAIAQSVPHEMLLLDLYAALEQLDQLTGATTADDILNRIFSSFCIGK